MTPLERAKSKNEILGRLARTHLTAFLDYVMPEYSRQWFHTVIAHRCQELFEGTIQTQGLMLFVPPQHGKQLADSTPVPTPQGMRKHGDLRPGDIVFGRDGRPTRVKAVSPKTQSEYVVTFTDGMQVQCHGNHEWVIYNRSLREYRVYETKKLASMTLETGERGKRGHRYVMQVDAPVEVEYPYTAVEIDPYTLGAWLGDGVTEWPKIHIGCGDTEIIDALPYEVKEGNGTTDRVFYIHSVAGKFKKYGLLGNKHIPKEYICNSADVRKQLIAGLIDTDGSVYAKNGRVTISNTNADVIGGAASVLRSLGQNVTICAFAPAVSSSGINGRKTCYQLSFNPTIAFPTKVKRKQTTRLVKPRRRGIVSVAKKDGLEWGRCIQVEGGVYLIGDTYIPTHNSEIVSRKFPAWLLGEDPSLKIVSCSYAADRAEEFSLAVQRTLEKEEFINVFPNAILPQRGTRGYQRNVDYFDTLQGGFYKAVGVCGSLTGTPADIGIIDDPVKDTMEAFSKTYRDRVWNWYTDVFLTRLHNRSKQLIIMTRWHEDDLAGRLLKTEPEKWTVVSIPAICEDKNNPADPREIGEALWEDKHSRERLLEVEQRSPRTFAALYQQRPTVNGGNIVKREWFGHVSMGEFNRMHNNEPIVFFIDTAFTSKTENDPTGIIATCKIGNEMYIVHGEKVLLKFPDLIRFIQQYVKAHGYTPASSIRIEPKANGISVVDQLKEQTGLNVMKTPSPKDDKETRLNAASPAVEGGRVILVDGAWNEEFIDEVCGFPAKPHDEYVDVLGYAVNYHLANPFKPIDRNRLSRIVY